VGGGNTIFRGVEIDGFDKNIDFEKKDLSLFLGWGEGIVIKMTFIKGTVCRDLTGLKKPGTNYLYRERSKQPVSAS
jgi:hypothetical protein